MPRSRFPFVVAHRSHVPQVERQGPLPQCRVVAMALDHPQPVAELEFVPILLGRACGVLPPQVADGIGTACAQRDKWSRMKPGQRRPTSPVAGQGTASVKVRVTAGSRG